MSFRAANLMQVACNWLLGWRIVEQEQQGKAWADYGKHVIESASETSTAEFGKGYSVASLKIYVTALMQKNRLWGLYSGVALM